MQDWFGKYCDYIYENKNALQELNEFVMLKYSEYSPIDFDSIDIIIDKESMLNVMNLLENAGLVAQKELTKENLERIVKIGDLSYEIEQIYALAQRDIEMQFRLESELRKLDRDGFFRWLYDSLETI
ncbi:hypothetical protein [Helicobacter sp. T3_23-1059]